ncbi:MAG: sensor histidine kinase [Brevinemataceae bacterium]
MFNKKARFLKKALETFSKLQKEELVVLSKNLIQDLTFILKVIEHLPQSIMIYHNKNIVFTNQQMDQLMNKIPTLTFSEEITGIISVQDKFSHDCYLEICCFKFNELTIFYVTDVKKYQEINSAQQIEDGLLVLEKLAASVSHEIKNPLTAIDIHTQVIQRQIDKKELSVSPEIYSYVQIVQKESTRLLSILDQFLNRTRKVKPKLEFTEIADILYNIQELFAPEMKQKKIKFDLEIGNVPKIFTAPSVLQQSIIDLLRNAMEAVVEQQRKEIILSLSQNKTKEYIVISVEDSGKGISVSLRNKVFEPYFSTKSKGTGLGLTLVKKIVREIGGFILLKDSVKLCGVAFKIYLPISLGQKQLDIQK